MNDIDTLLHEPAAARHRARPVRAIIAFALLAFVLALAPAEARAQRGPVWPDGARRAHAIEYGAIGVLTLSAYLLGLYGADEYRSTGPWLFDGAARDALRLRSAEERHVADVTSDIALWTAVTYPIADALIAGTLLRADSRVPVEMAVQTTLVLSAAATLTYLSKALLARERPMASACRRNPRYAPDCGDESPPLSFFSGHAALSFAAATMACVHHRQLDLYGDETRDALACAVPLGLASAIAMLRIMADQHYATDVIAGAAVGVLSGLGLGLLLHY
jgi:membrane-associated phospholipid phosphatase